MAVYASSYQGDTKMLFSMDFGIPVDLPILLIPPHTQQLEMHEQVRSCSVPVTNCCSRHLQVTVRCNNPAFSVNPVEFDVQPYTTVCIRIDYDQILQRLVFLKCICSSARYQRRPSFQNMQLKFTSQLWWLFRRCVAWLLVRSLRHWIARLHTLVTHFPHLTVCTELSV